MENQTAETLAPNNAHTHLIDTFTEITSSSREEALFFLESHNFDLDSAVSTFLETTTAAVDAVPVAAVREGSLSPSSSPSRSRSPSPPPPLRPQPNSQYNLRSRRERKSSGDKKASGSRAGGIHTISNLNRTAEDESGSDSDEPQEYYTGGEKSGMLVQDPSKANDIDALFDQARRAGGVEGHGDHLQPSSSSRSFSGTARLLSGETISTAPSHPETVTHNITFWSNGFTVDDGPLRQLDDPENASFLESIKNSECPQELVPEDRRTVVHVNLMRKEQDCPVPQKSHNSFQGRGRTLGGGEDAVPPVEPIALSNLHSAPPPSIGLVVDQALPSTSIQLRLADGTRMVSRFNYHHTIRDIRGFIDASRHVAPRSYQLQTVGFPPKQLNNMEQTIEEAGLANSVVIQKL